MNSNGVSEAITYGINQAMADESMRATLSITPTNTQQSHRNHYTQFNSYLRRNLIYMQRQVCAAEQQLSDEIRTQALHTLSYALAEQELWPLVRELLLALAPKMELGGHREDWLPYLTQGLEQSKLMADRQTAAECQLQMGLLYRLLSNFGAAREQLTASITLAQASGEARQQARALNELAWLEQLQEEYAMAAMHVQQAFMLLEEDDPEIAICYRVQGMIALGQKQWLDAERYHRRALALFEQQQDQRRIAWSLHNLAYTLHEQRQYTDAIALYKRSAQMLSTIGDKYHLGIVLLNLGLTHTVLEIFEEAIKYYLEAELILQKHQNKLHLAKLYTNLGLTFYFAQQYKEAEQSFKRSIEFFTSLQDISWRLNAMDGLAMTYLAQGETGAAQSILQQAIGDLPKIQGNASYTYLRESLNKHWQDSC